jgi:CRISPR/Cas system-associated exonuclease Cas4 (RecB family)
LVKFIILISFFCGAGLWYFIHKTIIKFKIKRRFAKGKKGEVNAKKILEKDGYEIVQEQYVIDGMFNIDGVDENYILKVDFLVRKNNELFLVEVKTGKSANPKNRTTRRQLLDYVTNYNCNSIYLLNGETGEMNYISFFRSFEENETSLQLKIALIFSIFMNFFLLIKLFS